MLAFWRLPLFQPVKKRGYSQKQMEYVRALANKAMHIEHAREQLFFYLQLKRRASRAGNAANNFSFELTYHLTTYSIYICSALDILARLINDRYDLGYTRYQSFSVAKVDFLNRLSPRRKTLADILASKKFQKWADWMFVRRNHITHESNLYLTPMFMEKYYDKIVEYAIANFDKYLYNKLYLADELFSEPSLYSIVEQLYGNSNDENKLELLNWLIEKHHSDQINQQLQLIVEYCFKHSNDYTNNILLVLQNHGFWKNLGSAKLKPIGDFMRSLFSNKNKN